MWQAIVYGGKPHKAIVNIALSKAAIHLPIKQIPWLQYSCIITFWQAL